MEQSNQLKKGHRTHQRLKLLADGGSTLGYSLSGLGSAASFKRTCPNDLKLSQFDHFRLMPCKFSTYLLLYN